MQELTDAIRSLANGKAVGSDGVSVELFKMSLKGDPALRRKLLDIVVRIGGGAGAAAVEICHYHGTLLREGSDRVRQKQRHLAGSARRQDTAENIARHFSKYCERVGILPEEHSGFRPNSSTTDITFVVRRLPELARKKRIPLFVCFIDLTKAYDSVDRTPLWTLLAHFDVPQNMVSVIRQFHDGMPACVRLDNRVCSRRFAVEQGLRQGKGACSHPSCSTSSSRRL